MKLVGRLVKTELSGGVVVLEGKDGQRYPLAGATRKLPEPGAEVELEGELDPGGVSIAMTGAPVFRVKAARKL